MKYITTIDEEGTEEVFTFPKSVNHDAMAEALGGIKNKTHGSWRRVRRTPISAGFVTFFGDCYGESVSLRLKSRPEDTDILKGQL